jgi:preprotein translocase subunit SecE
VSPFLRDLFTLSVYKGSQGRITRRATFAALALSLLIGAWRMSVYLEGYGPTMRYVVPGIVLLLGVWVAYRVVNLPRFADFLIAVEAEMNKVSWPSRTELFRSTIVVLITILFLAAVLYAYDILWRLLLQALGVIRAGGGGPDGGIQ